MKGQVLADFVVEFSLRKEMGVVCHVEIHPWKVFVDGAFSAMGVGAGIVIITKKGMKLEHSLRLGFRALNNEAKYEALLTGLRLLGTWELEKLRFIQILGSWLIKCKTILRLGIPKC